MPVIDPTAGRARRELDEPPRLLSLFGLQWLEIVVKVQAGVSKKTGEVRYRRKTTRYRVERPGPGLLRLTKEDGTTYLVTAFGCDCPDAEFRGRERLCLHWTACEEVGLLGGGT